MNALALAIRAGAPADLATIARIERLSFGDPWSPGALLSELQPSSLHLPLVAERGGEIVGYLMAWRVHDELHVLNIAVAPAARRQGVGEALMRAAMADAAAAGLRTITLEVRESNLGAQAFYRGLGFSQDGIRPGYYPDTGEDALIMTRSLLAAP